MFARKPPTHNMVGGFVDVKAASFRLGWQCDGR